MRKNRRLIVLLASIAMLSLMIFAVLLAGQLSKGKGQASTQNGIPKDTNKEQQTKTEADKLDDYLTSSNINVNLLPVNPYSRPGDRLENVKGIVIHYVGNPGTSAAQNRSYFEGLASSGTTYASSHYIVGLEGEIIQCVPLDEIAYASNKRNVDTISIECCHNDSEGKFNTNTYEALVELTAALCRTYNLNPETDIIRHYDVTGKLCPIYYVNNEEEWYAFKLSVKNAI